MQNVPENTALVELLRNANEQQICDRIDEIESEAAALRTLLRSVRARNRARRGASDEEVKQR